MAVFNPNPEDLLSLMTADQQELKQRMEAASADASERPEHYVEFCLESVKESEDSSIEIRSIWSDTWDAYCNKMDFGDKEEWQSEVVLPKPFASVQQAKAIVRKALEDPEYFTVDGYNLPGKQAAPFIKEIVNFWCDPQHAAFVINGSDAVEMGFITGQTMEIIPQWDAERGLILTCVPPWHITRDPDARRRDPWSGMYWIHKEWIDKWALIEAMKDGIYNAEVLKAEDASTSNAALQKDQDKKEMVWTRNRFRKTILVHEFWGTILSSKGELLLPNATYTIGGNQLIRAPRTNPYASIRWPGTSFSPFSHLLRFEGRGILEGVLTLWWLTNNMISLHADAASWAINKIKEVDPSLAKFGTNLEIRPGSVLEKKAGVQGNIVTESQSNAPNLDVLPTLNFYEQEYENGSFVNAFVQGSAGTRSNITKGEVVLKTQMSLGIFDSVGSDIECGLVQAKRAVIETIILNWNSQDILKKFGNTEWAQEAAILANMPPEEKHAFLKENATISIKGISAKLKQSEMLERLQAFMKRLESPMFAKYVRPYNLIATFAKMIGYDRTPDFLVTPDQAKQIDEIEQQLAIAAAQEASAAEAAAASAGKPGQNPVKSSVPKEPGNPGVGNLSGEGF